MELDKSQIGISITVGNKIRPIMIKKEDLDLLQSVVMTTLNSMGGVSYSKNHVLELKEVK